MPQLQIQVNLIATSHTSKIAILEATIDPYTLEVHSNILMWIHKCLQMFNCECKQIGTPKYKLFKFFYNLKCYNCSREGQRDKYWEYQKSFYDAIKVFRCADYARQTEILTGIKIIKAIDRDVLVNLLYMQKDYVRALWNAIDKELKGNHAFDQKRKEVQEPKSSYKFKKKQIAKQKDYRLKNNKSIVSFFKSSKNEHQNCQPNVSEPLDYTKQLANQQAITLLKKQAQQIESVKSQQISQDKGRAGS